MDYSVFSLSIGACRSFILIAVHRCIGKYLCYKIFFAKGDFSLAGKETPDVIEVDKENQQNNIDANGSGSSSGGMGGLGPGQGLGGGGMLGHMLQNGGRPHTPNSLPMPLPNPPSNAWHNCRKMIYVPRPAQRGSPSGFWPIPESFWPDINTLALVS